MDHRGHREKIKFNRTQICADNRRYKKEAMRIALSAKRLSVYIRVPKGISYTMNLFCFFTMKLFPVLLTCNFLKFY